MAEAEQELALGIEVAGRYLVEALLGRGGIAEVYRVRHTELGSLHALKVLTWKRKELMERFEKEGRIQARLRHPNVVTVTDILRFDGQVALVMEYVDGAPLDRYILESGPLSAQEAFALFVPILAAVAAAHDQGVLHRDIKPSNILLARTPTGYVPKVADFGIAKFVEEGAVANTTTGIAMGSPGYIAPEQIRDTAGVDQRADIFALGAILYEMLVGRKAFADARGMVGLTSTLDRDPPTLTHPDLPAEVTRAIRRAMARDREERFDSCRSFAEALGVGGHPLLVRDVNRDSLASGLALGPSTFPTRTRSKPSGRRRVATGVVIAVAGLAAMVGVGVLAIVAVIVGVGLVDRPETDAVAVIEVAPQVPVNAEEVNAEEVKAENVVQDPVTPEPVPPDAVPAPVALRPVPADPAPADPAPADPAPDPAPDPADPDPANPVPLAVAVVVPNPVPVAPSPSFDPMSALGGTWSGRASGRPFELRFIGVADAGIRAEAVFFTGTTTRRVSLLGSLDPKSKQLELRSSDGTVRFSGRLGTGKIEGTYSDGGKSLPWSVSR